jgi:hypothetical protein
MTDLFTSVFMACMFVLSGISLVGTIRAQARGRRATEELIRLQAEHIKELEKKLK